MLFSKSLCSHDISEALNFRNAGSFALKDVRNAMLCLIGRSNWIGEHSLMKLLWLVNNVLIKVLHTWQINRSYRSNVFNLDTNEALFRWSLFFCCCVGDNRELCFNVTCQFCIGVSRTTDYAHVIISYDIDYYQKAVSVNAFYKTCLASKFPCLSNFVAAAFQLCAHVLNNDGCPSVNSGLRKCSIRVKIHDFF